MESNSFLSPQSLSLFLSLNLYLFQLLKEPDERRGKRWIWEGNEWNRPTLSLSLSVKNRIKLLLSNTESSNLFIQSFCLFPRFLKGFCVWIFFFLKCLCRLFFFHLLCLLDADLLFWMWIVKYIPCKLLLSIIVGIIFDFNWLNDWLTEWLILELPKVLLYVLSLWSLNRILFLLGYCLFGFRPPFYFFFFFGLLFCFVFDSD